MECKMSLVRALDMAALSARCIALSMVWFTWFIQIFIQDYTEVIQLIKGDLPVSKC